MARKCEANCYDGMMFENGYIPCPCCGGPKKPVIKHRVTDVTMEFILPVKQMSKIFYYDKWVINLENLNGRRQVFEQINKIYGVYDCDYSGHFGPRIIVRMAGNKSANRIAKIEKVIADTLDKVDKMKRKGRVA